MLHFSEVKVMTIYLVFAIHVYIFVVLYHFLVLIICDVVEVLVCDFDGFDLLTVVDVGFKKGGEVHKY